MSGVQKVAINTSFGGFSLPTDIHARVCELQGLPIESAYLTSSCFYMSDYEHRTNPHLIQAILEAKAKGNNGDLKVVEVPEGVEFVIEDYDGSETVEEKHRTFSKWATL